MMKFGEYLLSKGDIKALDIEEALCSQKFHKERIGRLLKDLGKIDEAKLNLRLKEFLNSKLDISRIELEKILSANNLNQDEKKLFFEQKILIYKKSSSSITILSTRFDDQLIKNIKSKTGLVTKLHIIDRKIFNSLFKKYNRNFFECLRKNKNNHDVEVVKQSPFESFFDDLLVEAKRSSASDIHIESKDDGLQVRLRILGELKLYKNLTKNHRDIFINTVFRKVKLDPSVRDISQDSRASFPEHNFDVRVNYTPMITNSKIVLRILDYDRSFDLNKTGLSSEAVNKLLEASKFSSGVIIISGPTGSGKTTTLYSLISSLNKESVNISTLEDPVEYRLEGINQVHVSGRMSFAAGLRAFLRQDPDIILIGEIRDQETARLCFQAASTGHIVISTLHSNSAIDVIERLKGLGVEEHLIYSTMRYSGAQRLLKKLCPSCSTKTSSNHQRLRNSNGCKKCINGIIGRVPILESLNTVEINNYFKKGIKPAQDLKSIAVNLHQTGLIEKEEVLRL